VTLTMRSPQHAVVLDVATTAAVDRLAAEVGCGRSTLLARLVREALRERGITLSDPSERRGRPRKTPGNTGNTKKVKRPRKK